jgi:hypothetical protein
MARYHVDNRMAGAQQNLSSAYKTLTAAWAATATLCRGRAVAVSVGIDGAPNATDCQVVFTIQRQTADGTATTATPNPLRPGDVASRSVAKVNYTAEGTYALPVWSRSLNQRASMQWVAQDTDASLEWPATNLSGLALMALSPTYAAPALGVLDYEDQ